MSILRPMLAGKADLATLKFPLLASYKLDGIRCLIKDGVALSRTLKSIPNRYVQKIVNEYQKILNGLDGELIVGHPTDEDVYRNTNSAVMSEDGEPDFYFYVFDRWDQPELSYYDRVYDLSKMNWAPHWAPWGFLDNCHIKNETDLLDFETHALLMGYEGLILRDPLQKYKYGRSTTKEGSLLKLKRYEDAEAVIIGVEEKMHNANEAMTDERGYTKRSSHQENKVPVGTMGALVVKGLNEFKDIEFNIGTGFDDTQRKWFWERRNEIIGAVVKYKFFSVGVKDAPRHPVYLGLRDRRDFDD